MSRTEYVVATVVLGAGLLCGSVDAADVHFDPSVDLNFYHDGNINNVGTEEPADVARLRLNLVWSLRKPSSSWGFAFHPSRQHYGSGQDFQGRDFSERDYTGLEASIQYSRVGSERSSLDGTFTYTRTQRQQFNDLDPDAAVTYTASTLNQIATFHLDGSVMAGRRSSFDWGIGARLRSQDNLELEVADEDVSRDFNSSLAGGASVGWSFHHSARSSTGGAYSFQHIKFEDPVGDEIDPTEGSSTTVHSVTFNQDLGAGRTGTVEYAVGVLRSETDGGVGESNVVSYRPSVRGAYHWSAGTQHTFSVGVRQGVSGGSGRGGASLDRGGYLSWNYSRPLSWNAGVTLTYWERARLEDSNSRPASPTLAVAENLSIPAGHYLRFGLRHSYHRQTDLSDSAGPYHSYGVYMHWNILGERRNG